MKKNIFCIIGESGSGKNFYLNKLVSDKKFMEFTNLNLLVYGTTREKRDGEVYGKDYFFYDNETFENLLNMFNSDVIEYRKYKLLDKIVYYFTLPEFFNFSSFDNSWNNVICTASPKQYIAYTKYFNSCDVNIYAIRINASLKNRLKNSIDRAINDNQLFETCRRTINEKEEFDSYEFDPSLELDNNNFDLTEENIYCLKGFILEKILNSSNKL